MTKDEVRLEGLEVGASIGVYDHERGVLQRLVVDVVAECDLARAAQTDALEDSLDYDGIAAICRAVATERHHQLIETVAETIAARVGARFAGRVDAVRVRVAKPGAVPDAATVAVQLRRSFGDSPTQ